MKGLEIERVVGAIFLTIVIPFTVLGAALGVLGSMLSHSCVLAFWLCLPLWAVLRVWHTLFPRILK